MNSHHTHPSHVDDHTDPDEPRSGRRGQRSKPAGSDTEDKSHSPRGRRGQHTGPDHRGRRGRSGTGRDVEPLPADDANDWFAGRLPSQWFAETPTITIDKEEIIVHGELSPSDNDDSPSSPAAAQGRISRWRQDTRSERISIAEEAEARYRRTVSWGASLGTESVLFTHLAVPAMTRLRQPERHVLDTLVDAGVARSRSEALAWAVALVGQHTEEWLQDLRQALTEVNRVRDSGPQT